MLTFRYIFLRKCGAILLLGGLLLPAMLPAEPSHGLALYGPQDLKYGPDEAFDCANPDAPKGGSLRMPSFGSYTKLNYFSLKGVFAPGLVELVFETLMESSPDPEESFSQYGMLAEKVEVAEDRMSITYWLQKEARFNDGVPLTADDVIFSFNLIQDPEYQPFFKAYYADVDRAEKIDDHTVRFIFKQTNQELPLIMGQLYILPRHVYGVAGKEFGKDFDDVLPVGSGPYRVVPDYSPSSHITYERNPDYWGIDHPKNQGKYNFDRITYRLYMDPIGMREALKGGEVDASLIQSSKDWALEYAGPYVRKGFLRKEALPNERIPGMQCFAFNLRKPVFRDREVRKVVASLFDFEYLNHHHFYDQYTRTLGYWDNNPEMMSRGPAKGEVRKELLRLREAHGDAYVPADAIDRGPYNMGYGLDGKPFPIEARIRAAKTRLDELGWVYDADKGVRVKGGRELRFEIMLTSEGWSRLVNPFIESLKEAGIKCNYRLVQSAEFMKAVNEFKFDLIVERFMMSQSPGNEQRNYWTRESADIPGSRNTVGIRNPAADELVEKVIGAQSRHELISSVQALDRVLMSNHYVIPQWHIDYDRVVLWDKYAYPEKVSPKLRFDYNMLWWMWYDAEKAATLDQAMARDQRMWPRYLVIAIIFLTLPIFSLVIALKPLKNK